MESYFPWEIKHFPNWGCIIILIVKNSLIGHHDFVITIEKIIYPSYGECLISQGSKDDQIKMWIIEN